MAKFICETKAFFNNRMYKPGEFFIGDSANKNFREIGGGKKQAESGEREALIAEATALGIAIKPEWQDGYIKAQITKAKKAQDTLPGGNE